MSHSPSPYQIYDGSGELHDIADLKPPEHLRAKQSDIGRAVDIAIKFVLVFLVIAGLCWAAQLMWSIA